MDENLPFIFRAKLDRKGAYDWYLDQIKMRGQKMSEWVKDSEKELEKYKQTLKDISRILDNIKYECKSSVYTLDDDEFSWIFYCRDLADRTLRECEKIKKSEGV